MDMIKEYLKRIGLDENTEIRHSYDFLKQIQYGQVTHIPYENLDIIHQRPLSLDFGDLFQKIVARHRGGYCFEVNALMSGMLQKMGFEVTDYSARFLRGEEQIPMRRHRVMVAKCQDGNYLCDAGVGSQAPRFPLRLCEGLVQEQFGESYKLEKDAFLGWVVYELYGGEWRKLFSFTEEPQLEVDYVAPSYFCEASPDSKFNKAAMVSLKTEKGRLTIDGNTYKEFAGENLVLIKENLSNSQIDGILKEVFGISI